jgi:hypothetical protein
VSIVASHLAVQLTSSEVLSPSAFFQRRRATRPTASNPLVSLRPQVFSTSRRFAPRAVYRACFIPNPPLGFSLRGFDPPQVSYALSSAAASMRLVKQHSPAPRRGLQLSTPLRGVTHHAEVSLPPRLLHRGGGECPLGIFPLQGPSCRCPATLITWLPPTRFILLVARWPPGLRPGVL